MPVRAHLPLAVLAAVLAAPSSAHAAAPCRAPGAAGFLCTTLVVPLDREGVRPGVVRLPVAYERPRRGAKRIVLALSGGPGQSSVGAARSFRTALAPVLRGARLVVLDQRGTGAAALRCPVLQRLSGIAAVPPSAVAGCAAALGASRVDYSTADSVEDLDAVRRLVGANTMTIMGVSYGTYVAVQYARTHPDHVSGLILDSPVGPDGLDPFLLESYTPLRRIVDGWCTGIPCPASAASPWAALGRVVARLRKGPLTARLPDAAGRMRRHSLADEGTLGRVVGAIDLNPALQALMPGALAAAAAGDAAPLLRLVRAAAGPPLALGDLSAGLNEATVCADVALPFAAEDDLATRREKMVAALDAVPPGRFAPFAAATVLDGSVAADCTMWPPAPGAARPSVAPLPDVPTLILSGSFDQRTPTESARLIQALIPKSQLVVVHGSGHDTIDSDTSGCVARALRRFATGRTVGDPCRGADNRWTVADEPAARLAAARRAPGALARADAQVLGAVIATVHDAELQAYAQLFAGFSQPSGGGLRGGRFAAGAGIQLWDYELVRGVRVTSTDGLLSRLRVTLAGGGVARLAVSAGGRISGRIAGHSVSTRAPVLVDLAARPQAAGAQASFAGRYRSRR